MNRYSKGNFYVLNIPGNIGDISNLRRDVMNTAKKFVLADSQVRIEAPAGVRLFMYDKETYVIQSFIDTAVKIRVVKQPAANACTSSVCSTVPDHETDESSTEMTIAPRSFRLFR